MKRLDSLPTGSFLLLSCVLVNLHVYVLLLCVAIPKEKGNNIMEIIINKL